MKWLGVEGAVVGDEIVPGDVGIEDGKIASVGQTPPGRSGLAVPGFIDLQVNGFAGIDFADAEVEDVRRAGRGLVSTGVTAYQPTLTTLEPSHYMAALTRLAAAQGEVTAPRLLGVHLEGPFLSPLHHGAHDASLILEPDLGLAGRLLAAGPVTYMTVAPERPGALELIAWLAVRGVTVAIGHSDADAHTAERAFATGARAITHLFNASRPFHHRDPGMAFAGLSRPDVVVSIVNDGVHLDPTTVKVVFQAAKGRMSLVTDAVSAALLPPGRYRLGNRAIVVTEGVARLEDGTLAGSVVTMDRAVRELMKADVSLPDAVAAATSIPARLIGRPDLATLTVGTTADIAVLDERFNVTRVLVGGNETFRS